MKRKKRIRRRSKVELDEVTTAVRFNNALEPAWARVRYVKVSPEEMAFDVPAETMSGKWIFVGRGPLAVGAKPSDARWICLDPDVGRYFRDDRMVNEALRRAIWLMQVQKAIHGTLGAKRRRRRMRI